MPFEYEPTIQLGPDTTEYRALGTEGVSTVELNGHEYLQVDRSVLKKLAKEALFEINYFFRKAHLQQLRNELDDPQASDNDKFVIYTHLQNAVVASKGLLPTCQDTGTAIAFCKKGQFVLTDYDEEEAISEGIYETYQEKYLRYSQIAPLAMFEETNTRNNLPAQIDIMATKGNEYNLLFVAKGGGSANKMFMYQSTPAVLNEKDLTDFIQSKLKDIGTSACPPYHLCVVIGGTSIENTTKTLKLLTTGYLNNLPTTGSKGGRAFRDPEWEARILKIAQDCNIGAQFGGKYFAHDVKVVRLPRHAASMPIAIGVSCSADRQIKAKITKDGVFIEQLEHNPAQFLPSNPPELAPAVPIDLNMGMEKIREVLSQFPVKTRVSLTGPMIVARDSAHARIRKMMEEGQPMPQYFKDYPVYYAGPAKTPEGMATGSFGPTTAGRMDAFVDLFQQNGGSMVMLAKGNRSPGVTAACKKNGGFYLGSIGGPAAILAQSNIKSVEVLDFEDLGMEAIRKIEVENFPAFIVVDDKGNDFFEQV
jgi:fumarate hydratase class I